MKKRQTVHDRKALWIKPTHAYEKMVKHCKAPFRSHDPPQHHQISRYVQPSTKEIADIRVEENIVARLFLFLKKQKGHIKLQQLVPTRLDGDRIDEYGVQCDHR